MLFDFNPTRAAQKTFVVIAFTLVGCTAQVTPASTPTLQPTTFRLLATTPTIPLVADLTTAYARVAPNIQFEITVGNYEEVRRRASLLEGEGEAAYYLTNHLPPENEGALWAAPVGRDGLAVIVPREQAIASLTLAQVRAIFSGEITDWAQVGGIGGRITPISREVGSGTRAEFDSLVLGSQLPTPRALLAPSSAAMLTTVTQTEGGIGYVSFGYLAEPDGAGVRAVPIEGVAVSRETLLDDTYPLRVYVYIAGTREPMGDLRAFIGWVQSPAGQAVVGQRYAPLLAG